MKKILTASLVAIMAVTAANADIASTVYVDSAKSAAEAAAKTYADGLNTAMDTRVDNLEADNATNKGDITQLKTDNTTNKGDIAQLKADNTTNKSNISKLQQDVNALGTGAGSVANQIDNKINTLKGQMKLDQVGAEGSFVQQVAQADGKVTATATGFIDDISKNTDSTIAPQTKAVKAYVDAQYEDLGNLNDANEAAIAQLESDLADVQASLTDGATKTAIDGAKAAADAAQAAADAAQDTADAAVAKTTIGADANFAIPAECRADGAVCSLVVRAGKAGWEQVVDSAPAAAAE